MNQVWWLLVACLVGVTGCGTATGVERSGSTRFRGEATPTLLVSHVVSHAATDQTDHLSPEEFTQLLVHQLRSKGVRAVKAEAGTAEADYVLACSVPRLGYTIRRRYPTHVRHEATLRCSIIDQPTKTVRWQRDVERRYDVTTLLNTMTKLPPKHDSELLQECVLPVWDGMAYGVRLFLDRPSMTARTESPSSLVSLPEEDRVVPAPYHWMK